TKRCNPLGGQSESPDPYSRAALVRNNFANFRAGMTGSVETWPPTPPSKPDRSSPPWPTGCVAAAGFEVRDVESLREHYVLTLENWVGRLEANRERAQSLVGDVTCRIYRI